MKLLRKNFKHLHPFFFAVYPVLFLFQHNIRETLPGQVIMPLLITILVVGIVFFILDSSINNIEKTALLLSIFIIHFFLYGRLADLEIRNKVGPILLSTNRIFFSSLALSLLLVWFLRRDIKKILTNFFIASSIFLVAFSLLNIITFEFRSERFFQGHASSNQQSKETEIVAKQTDRKPDIYYLIFDRYANQESLKELYGYDNSEFLNFLQGKGFFIANQSYTNYPKTLTSLASSLNLDHLTTLLSDYKDSPDETIAQNLLQDFEVQRFLKSQGYQFIQMGDWWPPTAKNNYADFNYVYSNFTIFDFNIGDNFNQELINSTYLRLFIQTGDSTVQNQNRHEFQFAKFEEIAREKSPKFVFAHILLPHSPYVFDENCEKIPNKKENFVSNNGYLAQLKCTNKKIIGLVDQLMSSPEKPVIILQSDEGPFNHPDWGGSVGEGIDWTQISDEAIRSHMRILNAYYLPNVDTNNLYPSITPVNSFRFVFNSYFGTELPLLPDKSYIIPKSSRPYDYIDVTEKVKF